MVYANAIGAFKGLSLSMNNITFHLFVISVDIVLCILTEAKGIAQLS